MRTPNALLILVFVMCMLTCSGLRIAPTMSFNLDRVLYKVSSERLLTKVKMDEKKARKSDGRIRESASHFCPSPLLNRPLNWGYCPSSTKLA